MLRNLIFVCALLATSVAGATEAGWALLRDGGQVVLLRHAYSTGATDPANVDPENCATQRNLSERGRQQARKIGALFSARAADTDKVLSSRYCRATETARLAFGTGKAETLAALDPAPAGKEADIAPALDAIRNWNGAGNLVLVTHADVIQNLTGGSAREGEALIVMPDGDRLHVLARIVF